MVVALKYFVVSLGGKPNKSIICLKFKWMSMNSAIFLSANRLVSAAFLLLFVAACSSTKTPLADTSKPLVPVVPAVKVDSNLPSLSRSVKSIEVHPLDDSKSPLVNRTVYFEYDSARVAPTSAALLEAHSRYLGSQASAKVRLEGNADERGGREYNLALGQKRSEAIFQSLKLLGVKETQMESVSFGKEKPAALGHDEESWSKNRRVDIIYQSR